MDIGQVGDRLRSRRAELGLTIAAVAKKANLSMPYVANLERGRGNPTLEALTAVAGALEIPLAALVGEELAASLQGPDAVLASLPRSLIEFSRTKQFADRVEQLARNQQVGKPEMRRQLLTAMASAPRRSQGELTSTDWNRLLDAYTVILG